MTDRYRDKIIFIFTQRFKLKVSCCIEVCIYLRKENVANVSPVQIKNESLAQELQTQGYFSRG